MVLSLEFPIEVIDHTASKDIRMKEIDACKASIDILIGAIWFMIEGVIVAWSFFWCHID